jgi:hypothetical protein
VREEGGVTASEPLTGTGVTEPEVRSVTLADVPPLDAQESVVDEPAQIGFAEAVKLEIVGGWTTVIVTSLVTVPQEPDTVRR